MYKALGITNVILVIIITSPFWLRFLNKHVFHNNSAPLKKLIKFLRKLHKPLGALLALSGITHGYLALGTIRLHTGSVLWTMILITALLGVLFYIKKKAVFFKWHRRAAFAVVLLVLVHLFS